MTQKATHCLYDSMFLMPFHQHLQETAEKKNKKKAKMNEMTTKLASAIKKTRVKYSHEKTHLIQPLTRMSVEHICNIKR